MTMVLHPIPRRQPSQGSSSRPRRRHRRRNGSEGERVMPKMKTHRGAAKRYKVTGSGKIRRRKAFRSHLLEKKSSRRTRRLGRGRRRSPAPTASTSSVCWAGRRPPTPTAAHQEAHTMARVKRSVQGKKHRRAVLERAAGLLRRPEPQLPEGQRAGHALGATTPTAIGGRARASSAGSGSCGSTPRRRQHDISYSRFVAGLKAPTSTSTARSSPTSRCTTRLRSARWSPSLARHCKRPEEPVPALGPRHQRVRRLRDLIRDPRRAAPSACSSSRARGSSTRRSTEVPSSRVYVGPGADRGFAPLVARLRASTSRSKS